MGYGTTLEASIIGGGFARWAYRGPHVPRGVIAWAYVEGEEHPTPVKVRGTSSKPPEGRVLRLEPMPQETKLRLLKNMARAFLWDHGYKNLRIVRTELNEQVGHVHFIYIADDRHQLDHLVRTLSKKLHLKVTFEQMGTRDHARWLGGIDVCGRELCCTLFMKDIPSVSLDMARKQFLFVAPDRLTGVCGRLMCCLRYELPVYEELHQRLPKIGAMYRDPEGVELKVVKVMHLQERVELVDPDGGVREMTLEELLRLEPVPASAAPSGKERKK